MKTIEDFMFIYIYIYTHIHTHTHKKNINIYIIDYYSAIKNIEIIMPFVTWMLLESIIRSEVSRKEKDK